MFSFSRTLVVLNLMFFGAGLALFVQGQRASESNRELETRLERMEGRINQLLAQRQAPAVALSGASSSVPALPPDLDARIEQAVTRALQAQAPNAAPQQAPVPQEPPAPDTRNAEAWARGNEVVERALSARRWGDAQARELAASMPRLTQQQQLDLYRRLSMAINEGQLKVETQGPPF